MLSNWIYKDDVLLAIEPTNKKRKENSKHYVNTGYHDLLYNKVRKMMAYQGIVVHF